MRLTVVEPFHSIFYAPQSVALYGGHFAAEGLEVEVRTAGGAQTPTRALLDGSARVCLGGIMRSLDLADRGGRHLVHFAEVNRLNGFFLLARERQQDFAWSALAGRTVISFAGAPTPYLCMLDVLRRHGVDPARVTFVRNLHGAEAIAAFRAGSADFLEAGQPTAEELLDAGAHLVASMGEATGPLPFSSYMTTPETLRGDPALVLAVTRALHRAQRWMAARDATAIAGVIGPAFPEIPEPLRVRAVGRYLRQGTWARTPVIERAGYERLEAILLAGGFIRRRHRYADLVSTEAARRAVETAEGA